MKKPATTQVEIHPLIAQRWSGRAHDPSRPVSREVVLALLEAARWAPSCYGDQPWRWLVWNRAEDAEGWQSALDCMVPANQAWVARAPLILLVCADTLFAHNSQPNRWAQYDTGASAENLCLQAEAEGLMAHQIGGFDVQRAHATFGIPAQYQPMAMLALGYPVEEAATVLQDELLQRELAPRHRRPLGDLCFAGQWGKSVT